MAEIDLLLLDLLLQVIDGLLESALLQLVPSLDTVQHCLQLLHLLLRFAVNLLVSLVLHLEAL